MTQKVYSKIILSGEHSVLRGGAAVVAPLKTHSLNYEIEKSEAFKLIYSDKTAPYEILIEGTFEKALQLLGRKREELKAEIKVKSLVSLGKGLGGSAALCVFVSRVMTFLDFMPKDKIFSFSVELENMFHGESSGVDIAGCLSSGPHLYIRGESPKEISLNAEDLVFGLNFSGENGDTEDCIESVLSLKRENKELFYSLDADMDKASKNIAKALESGDEILLKDSFDLAAEVFKSWKLITPKMKEVMTTLKGRGALSVKPTGSGLGGYILSVWAKADEELAKSSCIEVFSL